MLSVIHLMVILRPLSKLIWGSQSSNSLALVLSQRSLATSLFPGLTRWGSVTIFGFPPVSDNTFLATSPIEISKLVPMLMTSPMEPIYNISSNPLYVVFEISAE
jgi:hypothetical protein